MSTSNIGPGRLIIEPNISRINAERAQRNQPPLSAASKHSRLNRWAALDDEIAILNLVPRILKSAGILFHAFLSSLSIPSAKTPEPVMVTASKEDEINAMRDRLQTDTFHAVITDNSMPGLTGFEVLSILRGRNEQPAPWVFVISGDFSPAGKKPMQLEKDYYARGADLTLAKPTEIITLKHLFSVRQPSLEELVALATDEPIHSW